MKILLPAILFFLWSGQASAAILSKAPNNLGLVGYWAMNEGSGTLVGDSSGFGNHATTTNMESTDWVAGKRGKALDFDGSNEYIGAPGVVHDGDNDNITISAWINPNNITGQLGIAGERGLISGASARGWAFWLRGDVAGDPLQFTIFGIVDQQSSASNISANSWTHVVATYDKSNIIFYVNGAFLSSHAQTGAISPSDRNLLIGAYNNQGNPATFFSGKLDEVRIYNRALTASEVTRLYQSGAVKLAASSADLDNNSTLGQGLVGHWTLDGVDTNWGSNTTLDRSGSGNTGTITNMSTTTSPTPGKIGQAFTFGSNGYVSVNNSTSLDISGVVSYSFWTIASSSPSGNTAQIISNGDNFLFSWDHPTASFRQACVIQNNAGSYFATKITAAIPLNVWNHITCVWDGTNLAVYLNGALNLSTSHGAQTLEIDNFRLAIGSGVLDASGLPASYFDGKVDDVRVYNRALSANEVKQLYNLGQGKLNASQNKTGGSLDSGLVGLWSFNGPDISWGSNTAYDRSGQGNHGTITNMSTTTSPTPGKIGQALKFDGSDDIVVNNSTGGNLNSITNLTVSAWVYPTGPGEGPGFPVIVQKVKSDDDTRTYWRMKYGDDGSINKTGCFLVSWLPTNGHWCAADNVLPYNTWTNFVITMSDLTNTASDPIIYINGNSVSLTEYITPSGTAPTDGTKLNIGNTPAGDRAFSGKIDEVRVYNRVLSPSEIKQLYNMGR